jgi:hypothetical protein
MECPNTRNDSNKKHTPFSDQACNDVLLESECLQKEKTADPKNVRVDVYIVSKIIFEEI